MALDELLGRIAKTVHALIDFDAFSIMLVDAEKRVLRHRFSQRYDQRVNMDNVPLGKRIIVAMATLLVTLLAMGLIGLCAAVAHSVFLGLTSMDAVADFLETALVSTS